MKKQRTVTGSIRYVETRRLDRLSRPYRRMRARAQYRVFLRIPFNPAHLPTPQQLAWYREAIYSRWGLEA